MKVTDVIKQEGYSYIEGAGGGISWGHGDGVNNGFTGG